MKYRTDWSERTNQLTITLFSPFTVKKGKRADSEYSRSRELLSHNRQKDGRELWFRNLFLLVFWVSVFIVVSVITKYASICDSMCRSEILGIRTA